MELLIYCGIGQRKSFEIEMSITDTYIMNYDKWNLRINALELCVQEQIFVLQKQLNADHLFRYAS